MANWKRTPEDNENIIAIYKARKTIRAVSTITGFSKDTVTRVLVEAGVYQPREINTQNKFNDHEIKWDYECGRIEGLDYQEREPKAHKVQIHGKKYVDVTEFYGM